MSMNSDKKVLICTVGLPRSGKTTWARQQGVPIVNPDSIRLALHNQRFVMHAETFVQAIAEVMVRALFLSGSDVLIVDSTNVFRQRRQAWRHLGVAAWDTYFHVIDTSMLECLERARKDGDEEIQPVIERMARSFQPLEPDEPVWPGFEGLRTVRDEAAAVLAVRAVQRTVKDEAIACLEAMAADLEANRPPNRGLRKE